MQVHLNSTLSQSSKKQTTQSDNRAPSFVGIGDLPGGLTVSGGIGISGDGSTVGGFGLTDQSDQGEAIKWSADTGIQNLGDLPGGELLGTAFGVSANGRVLVGGSSSDEANSNTLFPPLEAFRWSKKQGIVPLGDLPGGEYFSIGLRTNATGSMVVGSSSSEEGQEAFLWTPGRGMRGLGDLPGGEFLSLGNSISQNGRVVVGVSNGANGDEAFAWTRRLGMVGLGDLEGGEFLSIAADVSKDGSVIVGRSASENSSDGTTATPESGTEAFLWTQKSGMLALGDLEGGDYFSRSIAVSGEGDIIVGQSASDEGRVPFIWDRFQGMRDLRVVLTEDFGLDLDAWSRIEVSDISDDGTTITGFGLNPNDDTEGWVATLGTSPIEGTHWSDTLLGGARSDRIFGRKGKDLLVGNAGADYLDGGRQSDIILGKSGDDILVGGHGKDTLNGGSGDDTLDGGKGLDLLVGGSGRDRFILSPNEGSDIVEDFQIGQDLIQLEGITFEQLDITQGQGAILIQDQQTDALLMSLNGLEGSDLSEQDFITVVETPVGLG